MHEMKRTSIYLLVLMVSLFGFSTGAICSDYTCYIEAPDKDVYVRVFNVDDSRSKADEIWSGVIPKYEKQKISSRSEYIIYDVRSVPEGPFKGGNSQACTGGGVIRVVP